MSTDQQSENMQNMGVRGAAKALEGLFDSLDKDAPESEEAVTGDEPLGASEDPTDEPENVIEPEEEDVEQDSEEEDTDLEDTDLEEIRSLDDLREALELDKDQLASLKVKVKIDGEVSEISLKDLQDGYQVNRSNTQKSQRLAEERRAFEQTSKQKAEAIDAQLKQYDLMLGALEQQVVGQINSDEMAALRQTDQNAWLIKRTEMTDAVENFRQLRQKAADVYAQNQAEFYKKQQDSYSEMISESMRRLPEEIPDWGPEVKKAITDYAISQGLPEDQVMSIADWRHVSLLNKARLWDLSQQNNLKTVKKVKKAPQKIKKAAPQDPVSISVRNASQARKRFNKQPNKRNAAAAIASILK